MKIQWQIESCWNPAGNCMPATSQASALGKQKEEEEVALCFLPKPPSQDFLRVPYLASRETGKYGLLGMATKC